MSLIKNRINRVFCKPHTAFPVAQNLDFCESEIHDPLFDCCFGLELELDELQNRNVKLVKNPKKRRKKRKKTNYRSTSSNSCRCKMSSIRSKSKNELSPDEPFVLKCCTPKSVENLCETLCGIGINTITPKITKLYTKIPEHDKKILKRMTMKRAQEIAQLDDAWVARKCWEDERVVRNNLIKEHSLEYMNKVKEKHRQESIQTERRMNDLAIKNLQSLDEIRKNINMKEERLERRLRAESMKKEIINRERQLEEIRKFEAAAIIHQELRLDDEVRKQECHNNLEHRIIRAEELRNKYLSTRQRRLCMDNELEQNLHAVNYDEAKRNELLKLEQLKLKIQERNRKSIRFMEAKERYLIDCRSQARATAELRDIIRNSVSPDSYRSFKIRSSRPMSNMSFNESHLKLG